MKKNYLTQAERSQFTLSDQLHSILVGLCLGDLYIRICKSGKNPTLVFKQGLVHEEYLLHLYTLFQNFSTQGPKTENPKPHAGTGKVYSAISFRTYALPCFAPLYELFYVAGKKIVPSNVFELITPLSLCYWICDDGSFCKRYRILTLATQSFTPAEVELLTKVLTDKFNLKCTINKSSGAFKIRI
jgi:hypothetical protein